MPLECVCAYSGHPPDSVAAMRRITHDIQQQVFLYYKIDLSVLFYVLTALIMTGEYAKSALVDFGFAHNTPSDDQKVKLGMAVSQDGGLPQLFQPWWVAPPTKRRCGRTFTTCVSSYNETSGMLLRRWWWEIAPISTANWPLLIRMATCATWQGWEN